MVFGEAEARFRALVEQAAEAVVVHRDDRILYVNPATVRILGHADESAFIGEDLYEKFIPRTEHEALRDMRERHDRGELASVAVPWLRADGAVVSMEGSRKTIMWDGEPAWLVVARDVTEQRRAEIALRASESRYRTLFEASPQPVLLFDLDDARFLAVNEAAVRVYGYTRDELLAMSLFDLKLPADAPELRTRLEFARGLEGPPAPSTTLRRHRTKAGKVLDVEVCVHGLFIDGRRAALAVCTDVTDRLRLEEHLRQSQKMDAIGRLAGGIAHDFNNVLAVILAAAESAANRLRGQSVASEEVQEIRAACLRASGLTRQLLAFTRNQPSTMGVVELDTILSEFQSMLSRVIGADIATRTMLSAGPGTIEADRVQIEQLVLNLAINARDAMPSGGTFTIATAIVDLAAADAEAVGVRVGRYVRMSVTDSGIGMDDATRARIFEPFFSTKSAGQGTGLGLSIVFATVQRFGGSISCSSVRGRGTTFDVYFPLVSVQPTSTTLMQRSTPRTVLLVEDQDNVRSLLARLLRSEDYRVLTAACAEDALAVLETSASEIDLMLTDLVMPGMHGHALAAVVRGNHPHLPIVFMSGYADESVDSGRTQPFLQKPFTSQELFSALSEALGAAGSARPVQQPL